MDSKSHRQLVEGGRGWCDVLPLFPSRQAAVEPSTLQLCRGGLANSKINALQSSSRDSFNRSPAPELLCKLLKWSLRFQTLWSKPGDASRLPPGGPLWLCRQLG